MKSVNEFYRKANRPGFSGEPDGGGGERKSAIEMCKIRHAERVPRVDGVEKAYEPSSAEIEEALAGCRGFSHTILHGSTATCDPFVQKSLSAFSFAGTGMLAPPERMSEILSCILYPTDVAGLFGRVAISGPTAQFLIENPRMGLGSWACEGSCGFANNPQPDLSEGLGVLEIKPETIRFVAYATRDFLARLIAPDAWRTIVLRRRLKGAMGFLTKTRTAHRSSPSPRSARRPLSTNTRFS